MNIKTFKNFKDVYPEKIEGTDSWYYGQVTPCSEAYEVPDYKDKYPGTRLYFFQYPSGKVYEPIKQEKNVFLEIPVYEHKDNLFGIIKHDFNKKIIQVLVFKPECSSVEIITEIPFSKLRNLRNVRLITSPFALVKHDIDNDTVDFLWPKEMHIDLEENETVQFQSDGKLYSHKWIDDDLDYYEEIIIRDATIGVTQKRNTGFMRRMADGSVWMMTE